MTFITQNNPAIRDLCKKGIMSDSNSISYLIFAIVGFHLLLGFGYALYKISVPSKKETPDEELNKQENSTSN